tara:strand:- start:981 stop:1766 length:786 start_codon:yes stop_codon:yes gene_type:complete
MTSIEETSSLINAPAADALPGAVTSDTHKQIKDENAKLREQLALLKAKTETYDAQKREALAGMKSEVNGFIAEIVNDTSNHAYKHELAPMARWAGEMENSDALDTNLSIGRLISCASAKFKRTLDEASQLGEKSTLLAETMKELEGVKADREAKMHRITELEGLVDERTAAAAKLQDELAKAGLVQDKFDFSKRSARENVDGVNGSNAAGKQPVGKAAPVNMDDALLSFVRAGGSTGSRLITPHPAADSMTATIAAASSFM